MEWKSATEFAIDAEEVYFICNLKELLDIDLGYPGIKRALNKAFLAAKGKTPYATGLARHSFTIIQLDDYRVKCYFDPKKIVGRKRLGVIVKEYYPKYWSQTAKLFNFMDVMLNAFYDTLLAEVRRISKEEKNKEDRDFNSIQIGWFLLFLETFKKEYVKKKEEAKRLQDIQREKRRLFEEQIKERKRLRRLRNEKLADMEV